MQVVQLHPQFSLLEQRVQARSVRRVHQQEVRLTHQSQVVAHQLLEVVLAKIVRLKVRAEQGDVKLRVLSLGQNAVHHALGDGPVVNQHHIGERSIDVGSDSVDMLTFISQPLSLLSVTARLCMLGSKRRVARGLVDEERILHRHPLGVDEEREVVAVEGKVGMRQPGKIAPCWIHRHPGVADESLDPGDRGTFPRCVAEADTADDTGRDAGGAQQGHQSAGFAGTATALGSEHGEGIALVVAGLRLRQRSGIVVERLHDLVHLFAPVDQVSSTCPHRWGVALNQGGRQKILPELGGNGLERKWQSWQLSAGVGNLHRIFVRDLALGLACTGHLPVAPQVEAIGFFTIADLLGARAAGEHTLATIRQGQQHAHVGPRRGGGQGHSGRDLPVGRGGMGRGTCSVRSFGGRRGLIVAKDLFLLLSETR